MAMGKKRGGLQATMGMANRVMASLERQERARANAEGEEENQKPRG